MNILETEDLTKIYHLNFLRKKANQVIALDNFSLAVPQGSLFGLLGPNGAGKTTFLRCVFGLVRPTQGEIRVYDTVVRSGLGSTVQRVGGVLDGANLFPLFTGKKNLVLLAQTAGLKNPPIDATLERLGLTDAANRPVSGYSLGMRQRLALAAALLKNPDLLILDEPMNGMDPAGMHDIRDFLRSLQKDGKTILLSSHLLHEIEQICDHVAIMQKGHCIRQGTLKDVLHTTGTQEIIIKIDNLEKTLTTLHTANIPAHQHDTHILCTPAEITPDTPRTISRLLAQHDLYPTEITSKNTDLETLYLQLTTTPKTPTTSA